MQPSQEFAESPRPGEQWREMIERQRREGTNQGEGQRELLRSLPLEQKQEKERGDLNIDLMLMAETPSYEAVLREVQQRTAPQQDKQLER